MEESGQGKKATSVLWGLALILLIGATVLLVDCTMESLLGRGKGREWGVEEQVQEETGAGPGADGAGGGASTADGEG